MPDIETVVAEQRARLQRAVETPLMRSLVADYQRSLDAIQQRVSALTARAAAIIADGGDPFATLLARSRLQELSAQVRAEMDALTQRTADRIDEARRVAIVASLQDIQGMAQAVEIGVRLNTAAVERIVSAFAADSPLRGSLSSLPVEAQEAVRRALVRGVTLGDNPRVTARAVAKALDGNLVRAMTLARTETLRAYRGAAIDSYKRNRDAVEGWVWVSARDSRTCPVCWAMHGTIHPLDELFSSHANCRCSAAPLPRVASLRDRPQVASGEERFAELTVAAQRTILGPAKQAAYQAGTIRLADLVGVGDAGPWGRVRFERSLASVLGEQRALEFHRRAA